MESEDKMTFILCILVLFAGLVLGAMFATDITRFNTEQIACDQVATLTDLNTLYEDNTCNLKVNGMWVDIDSYIDYLERED